MAFTIDADIVLEVGSHEAIIRQAYKDSVGVWTWSVGLTSATGHDVSRYIGNPAPLKRCLEIYIWALKRYAKQVEEAFEGHDLKKHEFAAALSFHWNTGKIKTAQWVKDYKNGDIAKARRNFMQYRRPPEIIARREKERDLFFDGTWSNKGTITEYTKLTSRNTPVWSSARKISIDSEVREILKGKKSDKDFVEKLDKEVLDHTPKPNAPVTNPTLSPSEEEGQYKGLGKSKTMGGVSAAGIGAAGTTAVEALGEQAQETADKLEPFTDWSETIRFIFLGLIFFGIIIVAYAKLKDTGYIK